MREQRTIDALILAWCLFMFLMAMAVIWGLLDVVFIEDAGAPPCREQQSWTLQWFHDCVLDVHRVEAD